MRLWQPILESIWRALKGVLQRDLSQPVHFGSAASVDAFRCHHADAGMPMLLVVPGEERCAVGTRIGERAEALGEARLIFERLELRL